MKSSNVRYEFMWKSVRALGLWNGQTIFIDTMICENLQSHPYTQFCDKNLNVTLLLWLNILWSYRKASVITLRLFGLRRSGVRPENVLKCAPYCCGYNKKPMLASLNFIWHPLEFCLNLCRWCFCSLPCCEWRGRISLCESSFSIDLIECKSCRTR